MNEKLNLSWLMLAIFRNTVRFFISSKKSLAVDGQMEWNWWECECCCCVRILRKTKPQIVKKNKTQYMAISQTIGYLWIGRKLFATCNCIINYLLKKSVQPNCSDRLASDCCCRLWFFSHILPFHFPSREVVVRVCVCVCNKWPSFILIES